MQSGTMAAAFNEAWRKRFRSPPEADATSRDFFGLKFVRATEGETETVTIGCGKALVDPEEKPEGPTPRRGVAPIVLNRAFRWRCACSSTAPGPTAR